MYDKELVVSILRNLISSMEQVLKRFAAIRSSSDFVKDDTGQEKLDSICMQLIATGEGLKHIDKLTKGILFSDYAIVDWKKAMGMRDVIAHHYFDIDHETVYLVCKERIPEMKKTLDRILKDITGDEHTDL